MVKLRQGVVGLPIILLLAGLIIEMAAANAFAVYLLNNANFGARLSAEALSAAQAGAKEGILRVVRDKNCPNVSCPYSFELITGERTATVTIYKDTRAGIGKHEIISLGAALTKQRKLKAVVETDQNTGEVKIESIAEIPI